MGLRFDPFDGRPLRLRVGARPLDPDEWIVLDERVGDDLALKDLLLRDPATHHACVAEHPAGTELLTAVEGFLARHHRSHLAARSAQIPEGTEPLDRAGRLTQEDWCLLDDRSQAGPPRLVGASLCFPNRWRLRDKLGLPMGGIHGPVPGYGPQIGAATDQALARLTPDRPVWRINWSVSDDPTLHQPSGHHDPAAGQRTVDVGTDVVLRIERQTLVRLPESGIIVFGIRTIVRTLDEVLAADLSVAPRMAVALETMSPEMRAYKSLTTLGPAVITWLRSA